MTPWQFSLCARFMVIVLKTLMANYPNYYSLEGALLLVEDLQAEKNKVIETTSVVRQ